MAFTVDSIIAGAYQALVDPGSAVGRVTIESNVAPPLVLDKPLATDPTQTAPTFSDIIGGMLRPRVTMELAGGNVVTAAPYGPPNPDAWKWVAGAATVLSVLAVVGFLALRRRS